MSLSTISIEHSSKQKTRLKLSCVCDFFFICSCSGTSMRGWKDQTAWDFAEEEILNICFIFEYSSRRLSLDSFKQLTSFNICLQNRTLHRRVQWQESIMCGWKTKEILTHKWRHLSVFCFLPSVVCSLHFMSFYGISDFLQRLLSTTITTFTF